ncbi:hypothetical protein [Agreia pratensis]|uniref:hypothetical protein n=1 Tax=Agreia pratensis TaxID=150121 RepID=UPI00111C5F7B|nr:hypothetical protein [Agreia pratensis]
MSTRFKVVSLECDGSEVVIRFTPLIPAKLRENAEDTHHEELRNGRVPSRYGVSVLATHCQDGETIEDAVARVCDATSLQGRTVAVVTGTILRQAGFEVVADANDKEPHHHLVGEDPFKAVPRVDELALLLESGRMKNPAWKKGVAA